VRLDFGFRDIPFTVEILLEEGAELAAWIFVGGGMLAAAASSPRVTGGRPPLSQEAAPSH